MAYEYFQQYPDIFCIWMLGIPVVMVNTPDLAREILITEGDRERKVL